MRGIDTEAPGEGRFGPEGSGQRVRLRAECDRLQQEVSLLREEMRIKDWCRGKGCRPRFGAVGRHGSIAVLERFIQTVKVELVVSYQHGRKHLPVVIVRRPSQKDVAWMEAMLNREGRRFGTRVRLQRDGMLHLQSRV